MIECQWGLPVLMSKSSLRSCKRWWIWSRSNHVLPLLVLVLVVHVTFEWVRVSTDHWALRAFDLHVRPVTPHDVHLAIVPAGKKHGVIKVLILCSLTITKKKWQWSASWSDFRKDWGWGDLLGLWDVSAHCANESWGVPFLHMHVDLIGMNQVGTVYTLTCNRHTQKNHII